MRNLSNFFMTLFVLAMLACTGFIYQIQSRIITAPRCIEVRTEIEKEVLANKAVWTLTFNKVGPDQSELNQDLMKKKEIISQFFTSNGIDNDEMEFSLFTREEYKRSTKDIQNYRMGYELVITSTKVEKILKIRNNLMELYKQNIAFTSNNIDFQHALTEKIKEEMTIEASKQALEKAEKIASALGTKINKIYRVYEPDFPGYFNNVRVSYKLMNDAATASSEETALQVPKRKIKVSVKIDAEIK